MTSQVCIHDITSTLFQTSHPLYTTWHTLYLLHHSHCNYDKTPTSFLILYSLYMTSHTVDEWQHNDCIWHDTHCICVIKPTWLMTSHPMYIWNHTHCMYDTIGTLYDLTSTPADNTPLFVYHGTHSVYDIICIIYDFTHTVFMITQALYLTWNPLKLPSHPLYMSSHPLCQRHHTYCVRCHRWHMYAIICIIQDFISTLYDSNPYYLCHYMQYIHYIRHIINDISFTLWCHIHYVCNITHWLYLWQQSLYIFDIFTLYGITHSVMPTQPMCAFTATMPDITLSVFLTLQTMYQFYEKMWMYVITASICMTIYPQHMRSHPLFDITPFNLWHQVHYI